MVPSRYGRDAYPVSGNPAVTVAVLLALTATGASAFCASPGFHWGRCTPSPASRSRWRGPSDPIPRGGSDGRTDLAALGRGRTEDGPKCAAGLHPSGQDAAAATCEHARVGGLRGGVGGQQRGDMGRGRCAVSFGAAALRPLLGVDKPGVPQVRRDAGPDRPRGGLALGETRRVRVRVWVKADPRGQPRRGSYRLPSRDLRHSPEPSRGKAKPGRVRCPLKAYLARAAGEHGARAQLIALFVACIHGNAAGTRRPA